MQAFFSKLIPCSGEGVGVGGGLMDSPKVQSNFWMTLKSKNVIRSAMALTSCTGCK